MMVSFQLPRESSLFNYMAIRQPGRHQQRWRRLTKVANQPPARRARGRKPARSLPFLLLLCWLTLIGQHVSGPKKALATTKISSRQNTSRLFTFGAHLARGSSFVAGAGFAGSLIDVACRVESTIWSSSKLAQIKSGRDTFARFAFRSQASTTTSKEKEKRPEEPSVASGRHLRHLRSLFTLAEDLWPAMAQLAAPCDRLDG